jgi:superfamily II DNA/RNA helicase
MSGSPSIQTDYQDIGSFGLDDDHDHDCGRGIGEKNRSTFKPESTHLNAMEKPLVKRDGDVRVCPEVDASVSAYVTATQHEQPSLPSPHVVHPESEDDSLVLSFEDMGLAPELVTGIFMSGFEDPSAVQQRAIVPMSRGRDMFIQAQSGTGKTGTFCIGMLNQIMTKASLISNTRNHRGPVGIVLSHTRELVTQTVAVATLLASKTEVGVVDCSGNTALYRNSGDVMNRWVAGGLIMVGTPRRMLTLFQMNHNLTAAVTCVVMDEADRLLEPGLRGFVQDIQDIFRIHVPLNSSVSLVSATTTESVTEIANKILKNPFQVRVKQEALTLEGIKQYHINVGDSDIDKPATIADIFTNIPTGQAIVFVDTKSRADALARELSSVGNIAADTIHGGCSSDERVDVMERFRKGSSRILITTDLLARGIDVQQVSFVVVYTLPQSRETYLHQVGRTGRFGKKGTAVVLVTNSEMRKLADLEAFYHTFIPEMPADVTLQL